MYTDGPFHCYMLDESICHFRGVGPILSLLFYFWWKILLANNVDPDQTPLWLHFCCFAGRWPVVVRNRRGTRLTWIMWRRNGEYVLLELLTWPADPVGEIPAYAKLAEFWPRLGIGDSFIISTSVLVCNICPELKSGIDYFLHWSGDTTGHQQNFLRNLFLFTIKKNSVTATVVVVQAVIAMGFAIFLYSPVALFSLEQEVWPVMWSEWVCTVCLWPFYGFIINA